MTGTPIVPVPDDAPFPDATLFADDDYNDAHQARDQQGRLVGYVLQYAHAFIPVQYCRNGSAAAAWEAHDFPGAAALIVGHGGVVDAPTDEAAPLVEFSDIWLADQFTDAHRERLRYIVVHGRWYGWDGAVWRLDETGRARALAETIARAAAEYAASRQERSAKTLASAKSVSNMLLLACNRPAFSVAADAFDRDPGLATAAATTLDLRTGAAHAPRQSDMITRSFAVAPTGDCPLWLAFLARVTAGDRDLQHYLARVVGYCLTGHTSEHALFFLYGAGANGKSVFISTIAGILGDYAVAAPIDIFLAKQSDQHPTELARLQGARLVTAVEAGEGRRWDEGRGLDVRPKKG